MLRCVRMTTKTSFWLVIGLCILVVVPRVAISSFRSAAAAQENRRTANTYLQIRSALQKDFENTGVLPKALSDLRFEGAPPSLERFEYKREDDVRCIISFHEKHGGTIAYSLNFKGSGKEQR